MKNAKTKILLFGVFIVTVSFLPNILTFLNESKENNINSITPKEEETALAKEVDYTKGEIVFDNLKNNVCEIQDLCWFADGFTVSGDKILKKEFPTYWGSKKVLIIPRTDWTNISSKDKEYLSDYLKHIGVRSVITGVVQPAKYPDGSIDNSRNTITVDNTVWGSD